MSPSQPLITDKQRAALPPEFQALLRAIIEHYERRIAELEPEIVQLKKTPQNSSLPSSSQHPHAKPRARKPTLKKKRGGQRVHAKHERSLFPSVDCDDIQIVKPAERRC